MPKTCSICSHPPAEDYSCFTYGPFSPATDRRDLRREAEEELLDAICYAYLAILKLERAGSR